MYAAPRDDSNTIFVKGFDSSLGEDGVRDALTETFSKYGEVKAVRLPTDRETGDLKGIGFIEFGSQDAKVGEFPLPCNATNRKQSCGQSSPAM